MRLSATSTCIDCSFSPGRSELRPSAAAAPVINGDGEQTRDFVYVGDCARANVLALDKGSGSVYNVGTGEETSINSLATLLTDLTGYAGDVVHGPEKAGEVVRITSDCTRANRELGWAATTSLREGLSRTVAHFTDRA